jgi:hypothetical protein
MALDFAVEPEDRNRERPSQATSPLACASSRRLKNSAEPPGKAFQAWRRRLGAQPHGAEGTASAATCTTASLAVQIVGCVGQHGFQQPAWQFKAIPAPYA